MPALLRLLDLLGRPVSAPLPVPPLEHAIPVMPAPVVLKAERDGGSVVRSLAEPAVAGVVGLDAAETQDRCSRCAAGLPTHVV